MAEQTQWVVSRAEARAGGGMVAAKTPEAAAAGAAALRNGGNAVDAAIAAAFAAAVSEPWMNGIGGGGLMVVAGPGVAPSVVAFPMVAPAGATPEMFPLAGTGADAALFGWPSVVGSANVFGPRSVAVPGLVAGLALAAERFGTKPLAEGIAPAIRLAADGVPVTWHTTLTVARDFATLRRFPETAAIFLDEGGAPPVSAEPANPRGLRQPDLARTLATIASDGPRAFYEGAIAEAIVRCLRAGGAPFTLDDLAGYRATVEPALSAPLGGASDGRGAVAGSNAGAHADGGPSAPGVPAAPGGSDGLGAATLHTSGGATGGTTLAQSLLLLHALGALDLPPNEPETLHRLAQAFRQAFADRFAWLADPRHVEVPLALLVDPAYAAERAATMPTDRLGTVAAGSADRLGMRHGLGPSIPDYAAASMAGAGAQMADGSTTHISVVDRDGLAVSLTQTLLSLWGSRVTAPGTGVLLNNGMMWFDPEPGRPNSVAGGKTPLSNMAPAILTRNGETLASIGSSGGRRIMNCNAQVAINLARHGMAMQEAIAAPRIDASTAELLVSARLPEATVAALARLGHRVAARDERLFFGDFASPCGVLRLGDGAFAGGADPFYVPATAVGVG